MLQLMIMMAAVDDEVVEGKYYYYYFIIRDRPPGVSAMPRHLRMRMTMVKFFGVDDDEERVGRYLMGEKKRRDSIRANSARKSKEKCKNKLIVLKEVE